MENNSEKMEKVKMVPEIKEGRVCNCNALNVRAKADIKSDIVEVLDEGEKVEISGKPVKGFYKIKTKDTIGYCMKDYIEVVE